MYAGLLKVKPSPFGNLVGMVDLMTLLKCPNGPLRNLKRLALMGGNFLVLINLKKVRRRIEGLRRLMRRDGYLLSFFHRLHLLLAFVKILFKNEPTKGSANWRRFNTLSAAPIIFFIFKEASL